MKITYYTVLIRLIISIAIQERSECIVSHRNLFLIVAPTLPLGRLLLRGTLEFLSALALTRDLLRLLFSLKDAFMFIRPYIFCLVFNANFASLRFCASFNRLDRRTRAAPTPAPPTRLEFCFRGNGFLDCGAGGTLRLRPGAIRRLPLYLLLRLFSMRMLPVRLFLVRLLLRLLMLELALDSGLLLSSCSTLLINQFIFSP